MVGMSTTTYSDELAARICDLLRQGESVIRICERPDMPCRRTVHSWLSQHPQFALAYAAAKQAGLDELAEIALLDASAATPVTAAAERLRFDARRWYLSKLAPRKYGDRLVSEHVGADGGPVVLQAAAAPMSRPEVVSYVRTLLDKGEDLAGLPRGTGSDDERLRAITNSGAVLDPDLYELTFRGKE
jgi:hypothetical protein